LISQISGTGGTQSPTAEIPKRAELGKDAFLQLLTTQLAHQDPTAPQDNGQMIAQLAQFSTLEQLTQIQKTLDAIGVALGVPPSTSDSETERTQ
jgi:flagellar basal-body rod modification protein FlgD